MLAAIFIGILITACSSSSSATSSSAAAPATGQQHFVAKLESDDHTLDRGILTYTVLNTLYTSQQVDFNVSVFDVGKGPQLTSVPTIYEGERVDPQDVPTNGIVGVQITVCSNLTCQSQGAPTRQLVVLKENGLWEWTLITQNPGPAQITLQATTYDQNTNIPLHNTKLVLKLNVQATPAYKHQQSRAKLDATTKAWTGYLISIIGTVAAVAAAIFAYWALPRRRRRKKVAAGDHKT